MNTVSAGGSLSEAPILQLGPPFPAAYRVSSIQDFNLQERWMFPQFSYDVLVLIFWRTPCFKFISVPLWWYLLSVILLHLHKSLSLPYRALSFLCAPHHPGWEFGVVCAGSASCWGIIPIYEIYCVDIVVIFWGDPHFQTLDNFNYTFNGLGEYWMVKSSEFELQARTARAWNTDRQPSPTGTVFSAVSGRALYAEGNTTVSSARVHVEMTPDRTTGAIDTNLLPYWNCQH